MSGIVEQRPQGAHGGWHRRDAVGRGAGQRLAAGGNAGVKRLPFAAMQSASTHQQDFIVPYVNDLRHVVDMDAVRAADLRLGVDPLGGAAAPYWEPISFLYHVDITVVNPMIDPTLRESS